VLQAVYEAQLGNTRDAVRHVITALNVNNAVATEPQLISVLVYTATDYFTCEAVERLLALGTYSDADLSQLAAVLAEHEQSDALVWALRGELALAKAAYDSSPNNLLAGVGRAVWFARDTAKTLELVSRLLHAAESREGLLKEADAVQAESAALSPFYITTKMRVPSLQRAPVLWERRTVMLRCTLAALAAERFRMSSGHWPNALDELVPEYLGGVPLDPFSGQALKYRLGDDRLTIYSVGENGVDDGGQVEWANQKLPDIGFRLLPPERRVGRRDRGAE
jgi:hypothetical protein